MPPESPTPDSNGNGGERVGSQFFSPNKPQRSFSLAGPGDMGTFDYMNNRDENFHRRATRLNSDPIPAFGSIGASIWNVGNMQNNGGNTNGVGLMKNGGENGSAYGVFNGGSNFGFGSIFNKSSLTSNGNCDAMKAFLLLKFSGCTVFEFRSRIVSKLVGIFRRILSVVKSFNG